MKLKSYILTLFACIGYVNAIHVYANDPFTAVQEQVIVKEPDRYDNVNNYSYDIHPGTGIVKYDRRSSKKGVGEIQYSQDLLRYSCLHVDPSSEWMVVPRKEADEKRFEAQKNDSIRKYLNINKQYEMRATKLKDLQSRIGKEVTDDNEMAIITAIVDEFAATPKEKEKIIKDLNKWKISKSMKDVLIRALEANRTNWQKAYDDALAVQKDWIDFAEIKGYQVPQKIYYTYHDTISNPLTYKRVFKLINKGGYPQDVKIDKYSLFDLIYKTHLKGWEWYYKERDKYDAKHQVNVEYPTAVSFMKYNSHPQYRIINDIAFDADGKLLAVLDLNSDNNQEISWHLKPQYVLFDSDFEDRVQKILLRESYKQNAYNIQAAGQKANHYVKNQLGLEELTKAEKATQERATKTMAKAITGSMRDGMRYGSNTRRGRQAQNKHAAAFLGAMLSDNNGYYSDEGARWKSQVSRDWWNRCFADRHPYKIERRDETSFCVTYADKYGDPALDLIYSYSLEKPFQAKETITIGKIYDKAETSNNSTIVSHKVTTDTPNSGENYEIPEDDSEIYVAVEQQAEFPGGQAALMKWIANNLRYPESAKQNDIQGRVIVKFVIERDGSIGKAEVLKGVDKDLDQEALRLIKKMPKWQPGKNNGFTVRSYYNLPVVFRLPN